MIPSPALLSEFTQFASYQTLFAPTFLDSLARLTGFIVRSRKLSASGFALLCCFLPSPGCYPTLDQMLGALVVHWGIRMRKSSLHERFTASAVHFIRSVFEEVLAKSLHTSPLANWAEPFKDIIVLDSTVINLSARCADLFAGFGGGAPVSSAKIQFNIGLISGKIWEMNLLPGRSTDLSYRFGKILPGALYLFDLGYFCADNLHAIMENNAWFVTRYKYRTILYRPNGKRISQKAIMRLVRKMRVGTRIDMKVLLGGEAKVPCRLILQKLPPEIANQIRRKLKTDKQKKIKTLSPERLLFCDVNAYITNLDQEKLPAEKVRDIYAIRWQIEILFKTWKSCFHIDQTRNIGPHQFQCCLYGALIRIVMSMRIFQVLKLQYWNTYQVELSEIKTMKLLYSLNETFTQWIFFHKIPFHKIIYEIMLVVPVACLKETKKNQQTPFNSLCKIP